MNDAAETNPSEKRKRTDDSPKANKGSLIEQAINPLQTTLAPLPSSLTTAAIPHAQKHLKLHIAHQTELKKIEKYSDADYMPKSLKHNFTMTATNRLERHTELHAEFQRSKDALETAKDIYIQQALSSLKGLIKLEASAIKEEIKSHFLTATTEIALTATITDPTLSDEHGHIVLKSIFNNHPELLKYSGFETPQDFFNFLWEKSRIGMTNANNQEVAYVTGTGFVGDIHADALAEVVIIANAVIRDALVTPITNHKSKREAEARNRKAIEMQKARREENVSEDVAMTLNDLTLDSPELQKYIQDQVKAANAPMRKRLSQLTAENNDLRKKATSSANSSAQGNTKGKTVRFTPSTKRGPKADDADKDTQKRSSQRSKKKSGNLKRSNRQDSNKGRGNGKRN